MADIALKTDLEAVDQKFADYATTHGDVHQNIDDKLAATQAASQASIAGLTALDRSTLTDGQTIDVVGFTSGANVGGGTFEWLADDTTPPDGGWYFQHDDDGVGRFRRVDRNEILVDDFGAVSDGVTDSEAAILAAHAKLVGTAVNAQFASPTERPFIFGPGKYISATPITLATTGTGQLFAGQGEQTTQLENISLCMEDRHCTFRDMSVVVGGEPYAVALSGKRALPSDPPDASRRGGVIENIHARGAVRGILLEAGADDRMSNCLSEKNLYGLGFPQDATHSGDIQIDHCQFVSNEIRNIERPTSEMKFSNCVDGNSGGVGTIFEPLDSAGTQSTVEPYFSQMTHTIQGYSAFRDITAAEDAGGGNTRLLAANNFQVGDTAEVFDAGAYNGSHGVLAADDAGFTIGVAFGVTETGYARRKHDRVWRITSASDEGGGQVRIVTDGNNDLQSLQTDVHISDTGTALDDTHSIAARDNGDLIINAAFPGTVTGTIYTRGWDIAFNPGDVIGRVNDVFYLGGNINYAKMDGAYAVNFIGTRLKQQIWMAGENARVLFVRNRRGRSAEGSSYSDVPVAGPFSNKGWGEFAYKDDSSATDNDGGPVMAAPHSGALNADDTPKLNEVWVTPQGIKFIHKDEEIGSTTDSGFDFSSLLIGLLKLDEGPTLTLDADGEITVTRTWHKLLGNGSVNDTLEAINGGVTGQILLLQSVSGTSEITLPDNIGFMRLPATRTLSHPRDIIVLFYNGSEWLEIAFADNH